MTRIRLLTVPLLLLLLAALVPALGASAAPSHSSAAGLVKVAKVGKLGNILVTAKGFALYHWTQERTHQIKCTGACATTCPHCSCRLTPPLPSISAGQWGLLG